MEIAGHQSKVLGLDIQILPHAIEALKPWTLGGRIKLLESDSTSSIAVNATKDFLGNNQTPALLVLDSNHSHEHVLKELQMYSKLVTDGSYCVVFDTIIDNLPDSSFAKPQHKRSWNSKSNPKTAINEFLKYESNFIVDEEINLNLVVSGNPSGFLKRI
jgi:cephalosporin hydroxylase